MKISKYLALGMLVICLMPVWGQEVQTIDLTTGLPVKSAKFDNLTKFNLDFPGGTPKDLVAAIEKAMGKPLNAIIPKEDAELQMPPLKMNGVVVPQLFAALKAASRKTLTVSNGSGNSYSTYTGDYGFETGDRPSDASIWYFHANKPLVPPGDPLQKLCQFYSLDEYLNRGFTVDDITTAIQTGWKMAGGTSLPELSYHKETKLLIAYGDPGKLKTIREVLETLPATKVYLGDVQDLRAKVSALQKQVDDLKQKAFPSAANPTPEEKAGK
jgi:hypothetical protein